MRHTDVENERAPGRVVFGLDYWVLPLVGVPFSGKVEVERDSAIRDV